MIIRMLTRVRVEGQVQPVFKKQILEKIYEGRYQIISSSKKCVLVVRLLENTLSSWKAMLSGKGYVCPCIPNQLFHLLLLFFNILF